MAGSRVVLVPYCPYHVHRYHQWMQSVSPHPSLLPPPLPHLAARALAAHPVALRCRVASPCGTFPRGLSAPSLDHGTHPATVRASLCTPGARLLRAFSRSRAADTILTSGSGVMAGRAPGADGVGAALVGEGVRDAEELVGQTLFHLHADRSGASSPPARRLRTLHLHGRDSRFPPRIQLDRSRFRATSPFYPICVLSTSASFSSPVGSHPRPRAKRPGRLRSMPAGKAASLRLRSISSGLSTTRRRPRPQPPPCAPVAPRIAGARTMTSVRVP